MGNPRTEDRLYNPREMKEESEPEFDFSCPG